MYAASSYLVCSVHKVNYTSRTLQKMCSYLLIAVDITHQRYDTYTELKTAILELILGRLAFVLFSTCLKGYCTANEGPGRIQYKCLVPIYVLPEMKLLFPKQNYNVLFESSYTHISVKGLYISRIDLPILLQENMWTNPKNINRSQTQECGNWGWSLAITRKGIHKWDFHCSASRNSIPAKAVWRPFILFECLKPLMCRWSDPWLWRRTGFRPGTGSSPPNPKRSAPAWRISSEQVRVNITTK